MVLILCQYNHSTGEPHTYDLYAYRVWQMGIMKVAILWMNEWMDDWTNEQTNEWREKGRPIEANWITQDLKSRITCIKLIHDESEWDDNACQWNEMRS